MDSLSRSGIKLTFLGTGTSTGVPVAACDCEVCRSADPRDNRLRASAFIETPGANILVDCGPDFRYQAIRAGIKRIDAVVITHFHYDHVGGLDDLRPYCKLVPGQRLPVYCTADVLAHFRMMLPYCFERHPYPNIPQFDFKVIDRAPFRIGDITVTPLPFFHDKMEIRGYLFGRELAYITDCSTLPKETRRLIRGVPMLVINALRFRPHHSHMNLSQSLEVIADLHPRSAYLIHMSHDIGLHADLCRMLPVGVRPAYDTLSVTIGE